MVVPSVISPNFILRLFREDGVGVPLGDDLAVGHLLAVIRLEPCTVDERIPLPSLPASSEERRFAVSVP